MKLIMENWRGYLNEEASNAALDYLENAFKNEHASGRPFTKLFDESKLNEEEMPSEALEIVNSITPKYIAEVLEKYKSVGFKGSMGQLLGGPGRPHWVVRRLPAALLRCRWASGPPRNHTP